MLAGSDTSVECHQDSCNCAGGGTCYESYKNVGYSSFHNIVNFKFNTFCYPWQGKKHSNPILLKNFYPYGLDFNLINIVRNIGIWKQCVGFSTTCGITEQKIRRIGVTDFQAICPVMRNSM